MKKFLSLTGALALAFSLVSCGPKFETVPGDPMHSKIYTLDNGLKVYMTVNKQTPRIQTYIAVNVGAKNDPRETTGLAHYFEHLMFKGTESFGTSDYAAEKPMLDEIESLFETYRATSDEAVRAEIYHRIDSVSYEASKIAIPNEYDKLMAVIGAEGTNAWTSQDETVYTEDIPSNQVDNWARIQADRFRNGVIRGFHTELETIYEEKNMSLTEDNRKIWEALDAALYPHHPYGMETVLGSQDHLKNPSITNVKKYHDQYYVPNNIAICLSGDFDPGKMVAVIEKYFGDWEPNPAIPGLEYEPEAPIAEPVEKDVYGLTSESLTLGWRLPAYRDLDTYVLSGMASLILNNGFCGLIDLDVTKQQKALYMYSGANNMTDYGSFLIMGAPKAGQTLDEVKAVALEEVAKLRAGEFSEELLKASLNNMKLSNMRELERNSDRARRFVDSFIAGIPWADFCSIDSRFAAVTKEDVVRFANEYLRDDNCVVVRKLQGEDKSVRKISAPSITPIESNRDTESAFLAGIKAAEVRPIEPVFVDFGRDMSQFRIAEGVNVLYKRNEINDIASVDIVFNTGYLDNPALPVAIDYISYLGTPEMSAEELATKMYDLACSYSAGAGANSTTVRVEGLSENIPEALALVENLILNAAGDEEILSGVISDNLKSRDDAKKNQSACFSALRRYAAYGPGYISKSCLGNASLSALKSADLLDLIRQTFALGHEISYYGPASASEVKEMLAGVHSFDPGAKPLPERFYPSVRTDRNVVYLAQYDAKQFYYIQTSDRGEKYDRDATAGITLYNEYFGGGMNAIVFQEMREARGLAYSAWATISEPSFADDTYGYSAFIASQNDKLQQAVEAFDGIINDMPVSEKAFAVARESLISRYRTQRVWGSAVLDLYRSCRRLGLDEPIDREVFARLRNMDFDDVAAIQKDWVEGRSYAYCILGDIADLDMDYLKTLGEVRVLSDEDIFGY